MFGWRRISILGSATLMLVVAPVAAQDTNHWTDQFGNRARLLGGAVVGSAGDLSAVYYNPGAIAKSDRPDVAISADAIEYTTTTLRTDLAADQSITTSRFSWIPSFFGGYLRFNRLGKSRLAYCFLTRNDLDTRLEERAPFSGDTIVPQFDSGGFSLRLQQRITEYWGGITWSRQVGSYLGVGISNFVAVRNQRSAAQALVQGSGAGAIGALSVVGRNFDYEHWRLVWKVGLSAPFERWSFGINVTTPGVALGGRGSTATDQSYIIQAADSSLQRDIGTVYDDNIEAVFRSPMSAALGVTRRFGRGTAFATVEWFDAVRSLTVLDTQPGQSEQGVILSSDITYALHSVLNAGIGAEIELQNGLYGFASFRTDRSGAEATGSNSTYSSYDLYHVSAAAIFRTLRDHRGRLRLGKRRAPSAAPSDRRLRSARHPAALLGRAGVSQLHARLRIPFPVHGRAGRSNTLRSESATA